MKKTLICLSFLLLNMLLPLYAVYASLPHHIKIAVIFKNPHMLPYASSRYLNYYKEGLKTAQFFAKASGSTIEYHYFVMPDVLHLQQKMDQIKVWQPDAVIGPNYSNAFLLLKNYFKNILVLSAYANDQSIASLPHNFYSLNPLNQQYAQAVYDYIVKKYPSAHIFAIVDKSCKACNGMSTAFTNMVRAHSSVKELTTKYIIPFDPKPMPMSRLLKNYHKKDVILMLTTSDSTMTLMAKISDYLKNPVVFIGTDTWGGSPDSQLGRLKLKRPYTAIHIVPRSLLLKNAEFDRFNIHYQRVFHHQPVDNVTYAVFSTVYSILFSLEHCQINPHQPLKKAILTCYQKQLKMNPNAFRPQQFAVEQFNSPSDGHRSY